MKRNLVFLLFTFAAVAVAVASDQNGPPMPPQPAGDWQTLWNHLSPHAKAFLTALASFMGFCRLAAKPLNAWIQAWFSALAAKHTGAINSDFNKAMVKFLNWLPYVVLQFTLDYVCSIKLPDADSYADELAAQQKPTQTGVTLTQPPPQPK